MGPDPLASSGPLATQDPLTADQDPLATQDPLTQSDPVPVDPLAGAHDALASGPRMPTAHSHWLNVSPYNARVLIRLNGAWYGEFLGPSLRDITMRLRPGPNALTVTYTPRDSQSWMAVHLTEGEHHPPIPDLVDYRIAPTAHLATAGGDESPAPVTRSFTFFAR